LRCRRWAYYSSSFSQTWCSGFLACSINA